MLLLVCDECKATHEDEQVQVRGRGAVGFLKSLQCEMCALGLDGNIYTKEDTSKNAPKEPVHVNKKEQKRLRALQHKEGAAAAAAVAAQHQVQ